MGNHYQIIGHQTSLFLIHLGADCMANFSPVSRAEISPRPPEQTFLKRRLRLHGELAGANYVLLGSQK